MKDVELQNKVIEFLESMASQTKIFPRKFTAKETAEAVGGVTTRIGLVQKFVIAELVARGIEIKYEKSASSRSFVLSKMR